MTDNVPHIFLDCDGVLADFDTGAKACLGMPPREYECRMGLGKFWRQLELADGFYRNLPLMHDARDLVDGVRHLQPTILTGCPRGNWAEAQKVAWAHEHFPGIPVITCRSADKRNHAKAGDVLIDDWPEHRYRWIEFGGVFISHYDAQTSLAALWAHYPEIYQSGKS
jgi:5' nucleotidase, deoxy (Pyrimidine), cytosolic type C protein (NT5C)